MQRLVIMVAERMITTKYAHPRTEWPEEKCLAHEIRTFAWPLLDMADSDALRKKVIDPLLNLTRNA